jgi:hypothetical protein
MRRIDHLDIGPVPGIQQATDKPRFNQGLWARPHALTSPR